MSLLCKNVTLFSAFWEWHQTLGRTTLLPLSEKGCKMLIGLLASSVQFSHSVVSDSLRPHDLQHARHPCPSPTPRVHSDSHPSSQWCHPAISFSVVPFWPEDDVNHLRLVYTARYAERKPGLDKSQGCWHSIILYHPLISMYNKKYKRRFQTIKDGPVSPTSLLN